MSGERITETVTDAVVKTGVEFVSRLAQYTGEATRLAGVFTLNAPAVGVGTAIAEGGKLLRHPVVKKAVGKLVR